MASEAIQIKAIIRGLEKVSERAITKITLDVVANLVETTPIDTGWARAMWVPSIGARHIVTGLEGVEPDAALVASSANVQTNALGSVFNYKLKRGAVYITNNVTYITELNEGKSFQEPAGFVQRAIEKAVTVDILGLKS